MRYLHPSRLTRLKSLSPNLVLFLAGMAMIGVSSGVFETTFHCHPIARILEKTSLARQGKNRVG